MEGILSTNFWAEKTEYKPITTINSLFKRDESLYLTDGCSCTVGNGSECSNGGGECDTSGCSTGSSIDSTSCVSCSCVGECG